MSTLVAKDPELAWNLLSRLVEARKDAHATSLTFLDSAETIATPQHIQAVTFSDTIVFSSIPDSSAAYILVHHVQNVCRTFLRNGHVTRGAIVLGLLSHSDKDIFGPA